MTEKFGMMGLESSRGQYLDGSSIKNYSETTGKEVDDEVLKLIKDAYSEPKQILADITELLDMVSDRLLEVETITSEEFNQIVEEKKCKICKRKITCKHILLSSTSRNTKSERSVTIF